jgi:hypothetical protein
MAEDTRPPLTPVDPPASPPYANGYIVHRDGEVVTLLFMRVTPAYTDAQMAHLASLKELPAPVVASVTLTVEGAKTFRTVLDGLLEKGKEG